jgi:hypothetical protein
MVVRVTGCESDSLSTAKTLLADASPNRHQLRDTQCNAIQRKTQKRADDWRSGQGETMRQ